MLILRLKACKKYPLGRSRSFVAPVALAEELGRYQRELKGEDHIDGAVESGNRQLELRLGADGIQLRNSSNGTWIPVGAPAELVNRLSDLAVVG